MRPAQRTGPENSTVLILVPDSHWTSNTGGRCQIKRSRTGSDSAMCIGVPVQVVEAGEFVSLCRGLNGDEQVNMMLVGAQPAGTWVLNFLGSAREVLSEQDAMNLNRALEGLHAIMSGEPDVDIDHYFPQTG